MTTDDYRDCELRVLNRLIELNGNMCCVKGCKNKATNITLVHYDIDHYRTIFTSICNSHNNAPNPFYIKKGTSAINSF